MVRALRKASTQSLPSSNTGYALGMAGYRLFNKKFNTRNDVPKVLIVITDGRYIDIRCLDIRCNSKSYVFDILLVTTGIVCDLYLLEDYYFRERLYEL